MTKSVKIFVKWYQKEEMKLSLKITKEVKK